MAKDKVLALNPGFNKQICCGKVRVSTTLFLIATFHLTVIVLWTLILLENYKPFRFVTDVFFQSNTRMVRLGKILL